MGQYHRFLHYMNTGLWQVRLKDQPRRRSLWIRCLRVLVLSLREFGKDKCSLRAAALTYYTILSIVPVLAMAFGFAKGFGFKEKLQEHLWKQIVQEGQEESVVAFQQETLKRLFDFADNMLANVKDGAIAGVGIIILAWLVIKVLANIEKSFNDIWGVKKSRTFIRKCADYLVFVILCPIIILMASSVTGLVTAKGNALVQDMQLGPLLGSCIYAILRVLPFTLVWALFSFAYILMPNTRVRAASGLFGGAVAGVLYQIALILLLRFQIGVKDYNAVYGAFAALPFFLIWLQFSWMIVLYGAEFSFAYQHVDTYEFEPECLEVSPSFKRLITLRVAHYCVDRFNREEPAPTAEKICQALEAPVRLVNQVLYDLEKSGLLAEVMTSDGADPGYHPAKNIENLTLSGIIEQLENHGSEQIHVAASPQLDALAKALKTFQNERRNSEANLRIKDI